MGLTKAQKAEREQAQKRSEASKRGWDTKRAKKIMYSDAKPSAVDAAGLLRDIKAGKVVTINSSSAVDTSNKVQGKITETAQKNEYLSMKLGENVWALLSSLKSKFLGYTPIQIGGDVKEHSTAQILGAQERTEENLESCLKMIEELHKLQEEML